jgi:hypothetical protein
VRVAAYDYEPVEAPPVDAACRDSFPGFAEHALKLGAPVDGRTVLYGSAPVPVRDPATLLTPTHLPAGYRQPGELHWGLQTPRQLPERGVYAQWIYPGGGSDLVDVRLADPVAERIMNSWSGQPSHFGPETPFNVESRPTVRGHDGLLFTSSPWTRCVRWRESPGLAVVICHHGEVNTSPLPGAELLAVAEGLRAPGR